MKGKGIIMDIKVKLAYIFVDLLLPLMLGYIARRRRLLSEKFCNTLIVINILGCCTALSVLSFWVLPLSLELIWLPWFGIVFSLIPGIVAYLFFAKKYKNGLDKASYLVSALLSNIGTLGGLCAFILYGETGFAYSQIVALMQNLVMFLFCFPLAQYYQQQSGQGDSEIQKITLSSLFLNRNQLPVVGLAVGMMFYIGGVPRPAILGEIFNPLIHISAWMALVPVGYSIKFSAMKQYYGSISDLVPIKFIVTPLIGYFIARQVFNDHVLLGTLLVLASVPTGINAVVTARLYNLNVHVSGAAFVLTTAIFLVIVYPILFFWLSMAY